MENGDDGMVGELPVIDDFRACASDDDRADWLRRCPDSFILHSHDAMRAVLSNKGFAAGLPYLWARLAAVQAVRQDDGRYPIEIEHNVAAADMKMGRRR